MPVNDISLLPDDLRSKEAEARAKASALKTTPNFKMHVPENQGVSNVSPGIASSTGPAVSFGNGVKPDENKGVFKVIKKVEPPKPLPPPPPPSPPIPPKPRLRPDMWLKYFDPAKGLFKKIKPVYLNTKTTTSEYVWVISSEYWYKMRGLLLVFLLIVLSFCLGWLGIKAYYTGRVPQYNQAVEKRNSFNVKLKEYNEYYDSSQALINKGLVVQAVMAERVSWAKLFNLLEKNTLLNASYLDFQIINEEMINLTILAPDYTTLAQQVEIFENIPGVVVVDVAEASVAIDKHTDVKEVTGVVRLNLDSEFWN